jgi:hypothetical protein
MAKKLSPTMVPFAVPRQRTIFPTLDNVLDQFISDNGLPKPKTVVPTESRGLLVHCSNGDCINVYSFEEDLSAYDSQVYGLQGRIDGAQVNISGVINIPKYKDWHGEKLTRQVLRHDQDTGYIFLGKKASTEKPQQILMG